MVLVFSWICANNITWISFFYVLHLLRIVCKVDFRRIGPFYGLPLLLQVYSCTQISTTVYIITLTEMTDCENVYYSICNICDIVFVLILSYIQHPTIMALHYYNKTCNVDRDIDVRSIHTRHIYLPGCQVCAHLVSHGIRSGNKIFSPSSLPAQTLVRQTLTSLSGRGRRGR